MRAFGLVAALLVAVLPCASSSSSSSSGAGSVLAPAVANCAVPVETLSFNCGSDCGSFEACMLATGAAAKTSTTISFSSLTSCPLTCIKATSANESAFTVLVSYGTWKSDQELLANVSSASATIAGGNDTANVTFALVSNDLLKKIGPLQLSTKTTNVIIQGGSSPGQTFTRGRVANVEIDTNFLFKNDTRVTSLTLANLNLNASMAKLAPSFPQNLETLVLSNSLLTEFPSAVSKLKKLQILYLDNNFITKVSGSARMDNLSALFLSRNNITKYSGVFAKVEHLDLSFNQLTKAPTTLQGHTHLKTLLLSGNTIPSFTRLHSVGSISLLQLNNTGLKTYTASLPSVEYLFLSGNNLTTIPLAIFRHKKLTHLYMDNNKLMVNVTLSNDQARFVFNLKNFTIDTASLLTGCAKEAQLTLHNYTFCIAGGVVTPTATETPKPTPSVTGRPAPKPKPTSATRSRTEAASLLSKAGLKRVSSFHLSVRKSSPAEQLSKVDETPTNNVASVASAKATASASSSTSAEDPVALALTGAVGGAVVALVAMGAIWLVTKAVSRKQSQPINAVAVAETSTAVV